MSGKEIQRRQDGRRAGRIRHLVLAALLAMVATVLVAGPVLADGWPHDDTVSAHHHR
jgi:hypothetical protein